jgi:hypothetical protein
MPQETFISTVSQTVFTVSQDYIPTTPLVVVDGVVMSPGVAKDYQETDVDEITMNFSLSGGQNVLIRYKVLGP